MDQRLSLLHWRLPAPLSLTARHQTHRLPIPPASVVVRPSVAPSRVDRRTWATVRSPHRLHLPHLPHLLLANHGECCEGAREDARTALDDPMLSPGLRQRLQEFMTLFGADAAGGSE